MLKREELFNPTSCLNKAGHDELVFVLRAKDPIAAQAVRHWATMATGVHEDDKIEEAMEWAKRADEFQQSIQRPTESRER